MIVVAVDSEMHGQFTKLEYASDIFQELHSHLLNKVLPKIRGINNSASERKKIEACLKEKF